MKRNLILLLSSIVFTLLLAEIALRIVGFDHPKMPEGPKSDWALVPERVWTEYHSVLGWAHQKNKHAILKVGDKELDVYTNSSGFRGRREYDLNKPESVVRILCLGDSFVFGFGVEDHETFCSRLEAQGENIEVLNLGVPGYGVDQLLLYYRTVAKAYQPDYVLIGIFPEGFWRATRSFADTGHAKPYFSLSPDGDLVLHNNPVPPPFQLRTNQFPSLIQYGWFERLLMQSKVYRAVRKGIIQMGKVMGWLDPDLTVEWTVGRVILRELIGEIHESGAQPVLIILPPDRWVKSTRKTSLRKALIRFIQKEKVDALDLTPDLYRAVQQKSINHYYIEGDWHWTAKGHQLAADLIAHYLIDHGLSFRK